MMIFNTVANETSDGGDSDWKRDEMLLLDCNKNQSWEEPLEHNLIETNVSAFGEGAIPGEPKN